MDKTIVRFISFFAFLFCSTSVFAGSMEVKIDGISDKSALYIDFIDGDGPSNSIAISSLVTDGLLTLKELTGSSVSVFDGYELSDDQFLNGVAFSLTGATSISFLVKFSNNAPDISGFMDSLSVYLYADSLFNPSIVTDDPLGANSLFNWFATGVSNGDLNVFKPLSPAEQLSWSVNFIDPQVSVHEPGTLILLLLALGSLFFIRNNNQEI